MKTSFFMKPICSLGLAAFAFLSTINGYSYHTRESAEAHPAPPPPGPWFTGPLIAPSAHVISRGHFNIEPFLYYTTSYGTYGPNWKAHSFSDNIYSLNVQVPVQVGLSKKIDFSISPQGFHNWTKGQSSWEVGDLPFGFDIQLLADEPDKWWPAILIALKVAAPVGKYDHLDPRKNGIDGVGSGAWMRIASLVFGRLFHFSGVHYLNTRFVISYTVPTTAHVHGYNVYSGGHGTKGSVNPGNILSSDIGLEYSLTQNWVLALDIFYQHSDLNTFHGKRGRDANGNPNVTGTPSSEQFSLAPAFEYNWNTNLGLIAGVWFTYAGRNTSEFVSGVVAYNIYY